MNWIDASILIILMLSSIFGLWRGLVREIFSLVTWIFALLVARRYSDVLANFLLALFDNLTMRYVAAFCSDIYFCNDAGYLAKFFVIKTSCVHRPQIY